MSLPPGTRLGPYEILAPLGAGGMGEVYRARDPKLARDVALKILPEAFARDADRLARFRREAQVLASLNHPNIAAIYGVGDGSSDDAERSSRPPYLVLEFVDGPTLADRLAQGALPVEEALAIARQIADALEAAHAQGVIHRDLKPANVKVRPDGTVKVLDFGLAKALVPEGKEADSDPTASPTMTAATQLGVILGTAAYMAPEQARGRVVDRRADIWAFGCVVYEMFTGRRAFHGEDVAGTLASIITKEPDWDALPPATPPSIRRLLRRALQKDPSRRLRHIADAAIEIDEAQAGAPGEGEALSTSPRARERAAWAVAAVAVIAAGILAARLAWPRVDAPVDVVSVLPPAGTSVTVGEAPQVSPDGRQLVFAATDASGKTLLYVRTRGSLDARALPDTEDATLPFWSPDSRRLGFFARGALKTIEISGGRPQTLASAPVPRGGTWGSDGVIVFVPYPNEFPQWIPASGGNARPVPVPDGANERRWFPFFLPDGRHYLYLSVGTAPRRAATIRVASLDSADTRELVPSKTSAVFAEPGYLIFRRESALVAQRLDLRNLVLEGTPIVMAEDVAFGAISSQGFFSASNTGALAYLEPEPGWNLVWFDRLGRRLGTLLEAGHYNSLCITPDGKRILYDAADGTTGDVDIWSADLARGTSTRLTFDASIDFYPVCAPTADDVVFASLRAGPPSLFRQAISAPGSETSLPQPPGPKTPTDWSRDGRLIVYSAYDPKTSWDIWVMPLTAGQPFAFAATTAEERNGRLSPDGRWMAYTVQEGGAIDVYVQPFPATGAKWQVSHGGGRQPAWRADGQELFYMTLDSKLVAVEVGSTQSGLAVGPPRVVVETHVAGWERTNQGTPFAVTPDGQRFLMNTASDTVRPVTLVLNWPGMLKK